MTFIERFEKRLRRLAIPNITLYLVTLQGTGHRDIASLILTRMSIAKR